MRSTNSIRKFLLGATATLALAACDANKSTPAETSEGNSQAAACLLYTSPSPRDGLLSRMPSSA